MNKYIGARSCAKVVLGLRVPPSILSRAHPVLGLPLVLVTHRRWDALRLAYAGLKVHRPPLPVDLLQVQARVGTSAMGHAFEHRPFVMAVVVVRFNDRSAIWVA
jgi:hypothetical protein